VDSTNTVFASENGVLFSKDKSTLLLCPGKKNGTYTIPGSVTSIAGVLTDSNGFTGEYYGMEGAFQDCTGLTSVTISENVTSIGDNAFSGCTGLTSVTISGSVTSIADNAFSNCAGLKNIGFTGTVTAINTTVLDTIPALETITVDAANTAYASEDGVLFTKDKRTLFYYPRGKSDVSYIIPSGVTAVRYNAFSGCLSLTDVTIPASVSAIGWNAFSGCTGLTSVTFDGSGVSTIGSSAFPYSASGGSDTLKNLYATDGAGTYTRSPSVDDWAKQL
jgi:hypothetical protein